MHPNPVFRRTPEALALDAARQHGIGLLSINGPEGPLLAHIPFLLDAAGTGVTAHLARSNPILRALDTPQTAALAVTLGAAYVSPDWYGMDDQVPTLNYIAIHLRGTLARLPEDGLRAHVDALSARFEAGLDKRPWTSDKMSPGTMERMMRAIVPVALEVASVDSTWKLNQNKPAEARRSAAARIADPVIAAAMRGLDDAEGTK